VLDPVGAVPPLVLSQGIGPEVTPVAPKGPLRPLGRVAGREVEHRIGVVGLPDANPQVRLGGAAPSTRSFTEVSSPCSTREHKSR
jgi:hypothetical protein